MTVTIQTPKIEYVGDGVQILFTFFFAVDRGSELVVTVDSTELQENVHYEVNNLTELGGEIVFYTVPSAGAIIVIQRRTPIDQQIDYVPYDEFPADTHEWGLDKLTRMIQELREEIQGGGGVPTNIVLSVFGRIGHIIAKAGDYTAALVDYVNTFSGLVATNVQDAIDELKADSDTHEGDFTNPHQVMHDQLTDVSPDQHHNRLHDHTDPLDGQIDHDDLINVTEDQHHNKIHAHDGLDGSGTVAHADTTGITPDDHHDRLHDHTDLLDGQIDHADLINVSPDQHHNQVHLLYGADHSDVLDNGLPELRDLLAFDGSDWSRQRRNNFIQGGHVGGATYYRGDVVRDDGWLMWANKETTDRPAPVASGLPSYELPDMPPWVENQYTGVVWSGTHYTLTQGGWLNRIEVWVSEVTPATQYRIILDNITSGITTVITDPTLIEDQWTTLVVDPTPFGVGAEFRIFVETINAGANTIVTGGWNRAANSNDVTLDPGLSAWGTNNANTSLRINDTDLDTVNRSTELLTAVAGSIIVITDTADNTKSMTWTVNGAPVDQITHVSWSALTYDGAGPTGVPPIGNPCTITITVPTPSPAKYVEIVDHWLANQPTWATVKGEILFDGADAVNNPGIMAQNDNAYGIRVEFQPAYISPDWELMAQQSSSGSGGSFTPEVFAGAGTTGYVPDPVSESGRGLTDDGSWQDFTPKSSMRFFNGAVLESNKVEVLSDGVTGTCELFNSVTPTDPLTFIFNNEYFSIAPPFIVNLIAGTDAVPQRNWVYIPESTKVMTVSTVNFPSSEQFVPVADIMMQSAASALTYGFTKVHAWTDHLADSRPQGHLSHINSWIRTRNAKWYDGVVLSTSVAEGVSAALIDISYTSGTIFQLHSHTFDSFDSTLEDLFVINDPTTAYLPLSNLNSTDLSQDSTGSTLANRVYNVVLWGVISEDLKDCQVYLNLPSGSYGNEASGISDVANTTNFNIPVEFIGTGFLITRLVLRNQGGNIEIVNGGTFDLRGSVPANQGGGAIGGSGVTDFLQLDDTPLEYTGEGGKNVSVNLAENALEFTDPPPAQTYLHEDLTDVTENQHHNKLHTVTDQTHHDFPAVPAGDFLRDDGTWADAGGGGGGGRTILYKVASYTAVASDEVATNSVGGGFTITLPATPSTDDYVRVFDVGGDWSNNNVIIDPNGKLIDVDLTELYLNIDWGDIEFIYNGTLWKIHPAGTEIR